MDADHPAAPRSIDPTACPAVGVPGYAIIAGHGRSGTNWLLQLFDQSPGTFCRNEPYFASNSPFRSIVDDRLTVRRDQTDLHQRWDSTVDWAATHMGKRDHEIAQRKDFIYSWSRHLGLCRLVSGTRYRRALSWISPQLNGDEWLLPKWLGDRARLQRARAFLKLVQSPGWVCYVLQHRPQVPVFHIVRHPAGFVKSWQRRYLQSDLAGNVLQENLDRLREIVHEDSTWSALFGEVDALDVLTSELLYWRYATEMIHRAGAGSAAYHLVLYEELANDPLTSVRQMYAKAELEWTGEIEQAVQGLCSEAPSLASAWRNQLSAETIATIESQLHSGPLGGWWNAAGEPRLRNGGFDP